MKKQLVQFALLSLVLAFFTLGAGEAQTSENGSEIVVQSSQDSGSGSLRAAMRNVKAGTVIRFSIEVFPKESPTVIQVLSGLPPLEAGFITIDASDAGVILDGSRVPSDTGMPGFDINSDGNIIMGLQIVNFPSGGILISNGARENRIGGTGPGEGNVIGGNWDGIGISGRGTANNMVIGNFIGTDASGMRANGNTYDGIWIGDNARDNIVGGRFGIEGNLISGNVHSGIVLDNGSGNIVSGNIIGLDAEGVQALSNGAYNGWTGGIVINASRENDSANDNIIGGLEPSDRNVISGNNGFGIILSGGGVSGNRVIGNDIGISTDGQTAAGNKFVGVEISNGAHQNEVGPGNRIAFNESDGILVEGDLTVGNIITRNSIYANKGDAIINLEGSSLNISPPEISQVSSRSVRGRAEPGQLIEIFSDVEDESSYFEGETTADQTGAFYFVLPSGIFQNSFVTATVRGQYGSTSQLGASLENTSSSVGKELPGIISPAQISTEPAVIGTNLALASIAVLFFGFTSTAFNDMLENYSGDITAVFANLTPSFLRDFFSRAGKDAHPATGLRWNFLWMWFMIVLANATIESFLDPQLSLLGSERLATILTLFSAGLVVSGLKWISDHYSHRLLVKTASPRINIQTAGLLLGIASVLFSRLMAFTPGYLYGIVGVVFLLPRIEGRKESGLRALLVQSSIFIGGLLLWWFSSLLPQRMLWLEPFLLTAFLISLQGVLFELIPLDIFDGRDLWKWRKGVWLLFFGLVFFCFFHFMLNPAASDLQALQQNSVRTLLIVMTVFGLITFGAWLRFSRPHRKK